MVGFTAVSSVSLICPAPPVIPKKIKSLDALVRSKELELEQAAEAYRNLQWLEQKSEKEEKNSLREKDAIINQLQAALQTCSQEMQVNTFYHKPVLPVLL